MYNYITMHSEVINNYNCHYRHRRSGLTWLLRFRIRTNGELWKTC